MEISIDTAQHVNIAYKSAGLVHRIGATFIDFALLGGLFLIGVGATSFLRNQDGYSILITVLAIVLMLYHLICEFFFNGRSVGKAALQMRVVRLDGRKLSFWDCLLRWSLRLVDISASMGIVAMVSIIITSRMQRLGDLAANTTVILEKKSGSLRLFERYNTPDDYIVRFPQIAMLSDKDFSIIQEIMQEFEKNKEYRLLEPLAIKIKTLTGIQTDMNNLSFIQTILQDYIHLTKQ